jgi:hypothetical protein
LKQFPSAWAHATHDNPVALESNYRLLSSSGLYESEAAKQKQQANRNFDGKNALHHRDKERNYGNE